MPRRRLIADDDRCSKIKSLRFYFLYEIVSCGRTPAPRLNLTTSNGFFHLPMLCCPVVVVAAHLPSLHSGLCLEVSTNSVPRESRFALVISSTRVYYIQSPSQAAPWATYLHTTSNGIDLLQALNALVSASTHAPSAPGGVCVCAVPGLVFDLWVGGSGTQSMLPTRAPICNSAAS